MSEGEVLAQLEATRSLELEHEPFSSYYDALHVRLLLGGEALNPDNDKLPSVYKTQIKDFEERKGDYVIFNEVSTKERQRLAGVSKDKLEQAIDEWIVGTKEKKGMLEVLTQDFSQAESFDSQKAQKWKTTLNQFLKHLGIEDISKATKTDIREKIYDRFCHGERKDSDLYQFVLDILSSQDNDFVAIKNNIDVYRWFAGMFGVESQQLATHLSVAETGYKQNPDTVIDKANAETDKKDEKGEVIARRNDLNAEEKEVLRFVWEGGAELPKIEQKEEQIKKNIIEGKGFKVIEKIGWEEYQKKLRQISYGEMVEYQIKEIQRFRQEGQSDRVFTRDELIAANTQAKTRAKQLTEELVAKYGKDKSLPYCAFYSDEKAGFDGSKKFQIVGRDVDWDRGPLTRFYLNIYNRYTPEGLNSLSEALREEGALDQINLTLNLDDCFGPGAEATNLTDNNIIIYVPAGNPEIMTKIARAIKKAKQNNPDIWGVIASDLAKAKDSMVCYFKIPVDEATGFVEMSTDLSYDTTERILLQEELIGKAQDIWNQYDANEVYRLIKVWTPENPGMFKNPSLQNRRKYMPGLVLEGNKDLTTEEKGKENDLSPEMKKVLDSLSPDLPEQFKEQAEEAAAHIHRLVNNQWAGHPETERFWEALFSRANFLPISFFENQPYIEYRHLQHEYDKLKARISFANFSTLPKSEQEASIRWKEKYEKELSLINEQEILQQTPEFIAKGLKSFDPPRPKKGKEFNTQYFSFGYLPAGINSGADWKHVSTPLGRDRNTECKLYVAGENMDKMVDVSLQKIFQETGDNVHASKIGGGYGYLVLYCPDQDKAKKTIEILARYGISPRGPAQDEIYKHVEKDGSYTYESIDSCDGILHRDVNIILPRLNEFPNLIDYEVEFFRRWLIYCFKLNRAPNNPLARSFDHIFPKKLTQVDYDNLISVEANPFKT